METPLVSVVMTVYNGEKFLGEAVKSVLNQTYSNFEIIVVVEAGTSDNTVSILRDFNDSRIKIIINESKLGLSKSLNRGLELAGGKYIARLDDDDIYAREKLSRQVEFLEMYPLVGMCGTNACLIDRHNQIIGLTDLKTKPQNLKMILYIENPFVSSSVMMRSEILKRYKLTYYGNVSEDYQLWIKIAHKCKVYNLPEYLIGYRVSDTNRSKRLIREQQRRNKEIQEKLWKNAGISYCLEHEFCFQINSIRTITIREQMLKRLYCSERFSHMEVCDFQEVMVKFYHIANLDMAESLKHYRALAADFYNKFNLCEIYLCQMRLWIRLQQWRLVVKKKKGRRFSTNE